MGVARNRKEQIEKMKKREDRLRYLILKYTRWRGENVELLLKNRRYERRCL